MATRFQQKRDLAATWTTNDPILLNGEFGYETDTGYFKIGDGVTVWTSLLYTTGAGLVDIEALAKTDGNFIVGNGTNWVAESGATARTSLGLTVGTDVQAYGSVLDDLNTLGAAASDGQMIVATGAGAFAYESTTVARTSLGIGEADNPTFAGATLTDGNLTFTGTAGFYPRVLDQSAEPAAGIGATQCDTGEAIIWTDTDDSKCYLCYNHGGTIKTVEMI